MGNGFTLADHHHALNVEYVELPTHAVHGGLVGRLLVPAPDEVGAGDGRGPGHPG